MNIQYLRAIHEKVEVHSLPDGDHHSGPWTMPSLLAGTPQASVRAQPSVKLEGRGETIGEKEDVRRQGGKEKWRKRKEGENGRRWRKEISWNRGEYRLHQG